MKIKNCYVQTDSMTGICKIIFEYQEKYIVFDSMKRRILKKKYNSKIFFTDYLFDYCLYRKIY